MERKIISCKYLAKEKLLKGVKKIKGISLPKRRDEICGKIIEYGILGLLIFTPLPVASVNEWSILIIQLTVLVMIGAYFLMEEKPRNSELLKLSLRWPKYLFVGLFMFLFIQILPFPNFLLKVLSPNAFNFQKIFSVEFANRNALSFSLIPSHTFQEILGLLSYFLIGFLIVKTVTERRQIKRIFYILIGMGIFESFYGLFELYNKNPRILFYKKIHGLDSVTGTFVNRNHLSGYLEMILPLAIGLIIARVDLFSLSGFKWREKFIRFSEKGYAINVLISFGVIIMSLAIIFSKSRSGIFLLIFIFILFFSLTLLNLKRSEEKKRLIWNFLKVTFSLIIIISLIVGIDAAIERFSLNKLLREERPTFWANTVEMISDFPLFGTGLGTFGSIYPDLEGEDEPIQLNHAHNDYLEYSAELGLLGILFLLGGILIIFFNSFILWWERRYPWVKGMTLGGIVSLSCMLIHSITDFNLHIPANMMLFTVVLSLTIVTASFRHHKTNKESTDKKTQRFEKTTKN